MYTYMYVCIYIFKLQYPFFSRFLPGPGLCIQHHSLTLTRSFCISRTAKPTWRLSLDILYISSDIKKGNIHIHVYCE